jgi:hypothetical protein
MYVYLDILLKLDIDGKITTQPYDKPYFNFSNTVRIRVRIDPLHPLVCRKGRLNGAVLRMRPEKPTSRVTAGVAR